MAEHFDERLQLASDLAHQRVASEAAQRGVTERRRERQEGAITHRCEALAGRTKRRRESNMQSDRHPRRD